MNSKQSKFWKITFWTFVAVSLMFVLFVFKQNFDIHKLLDQAESLPDNIWVFLGFQLVYIFGSWLFIPISVTTVMVLIVFPLPKAILATTIGVLLASSAAYLIGFWGAPLLRKEKYRKHLKKIESEIDQHGFWAIGALRLSPQPPFLVTSLLSGFLKLNFVAYLSASLIGLTPMLLLTFLFGQQAIEVIKSPSTVAITSLAAMVILIPIYYKIRQSYLKNRKTKRVQNFIKEKANT